MDKDLIIKLKEKTGAGMRDCKNALEESEGDIEVAACYLRLLSQPLARYRLINGEKRHWNNADYLNEARNVAKNWIGVVMHDEEDTI